MVEQITSTEPEGDTRDAEQRRARSTIQFPYGDLDDAVAVARVIHQNFGEQCGLDQLAPRMGHDNIRSGAFQGKIATARTFGLIEVSRQVASLTPLGRNIVDPQRERQARIEAFLAVPLYKALYEKYRGHQLPPDVGLEREIVGLGVSEKQRSKARQALQRSADQSGFFDHGRDRLVTPAGGSTVEAPPPPGEEPTPGGEREQFGGRGDGGGFHPFIQGLLDTLPAPDSVWPQNERKKWLETAENIFSLIYKEGTTRPQSTPRPEGQRD